MATLRIRVNPGASRNRVEGYDDGVVRLRVTAPPDAGKANAAVTELLSNFLGISRSRLKIVRGAASRNKVLEVTGLESPVLEELLVDLTKRGRE